MNTDAQRQLWKNATLQQLNGVYSIANLRQALLAACSNATTRRQRRLLTSMALQIDFDLTWRSVADASSDDALSLLHQAFDTEQESSNYLIKLVPNDHALVAAVYGPIPWHH